MAHEAGELAIAFVLKGSPGVDGRRDHVVADAITATVVVGMIKAIAHEMRTFRKAPG